MPCIGSGEILFSVEMQQIYLSESNALETQMSMPFYQVQMLLMFVHFKMYKLSVNPETLDLQL